jgi:hypothetical protein
MRGDYSLCLFVLGQFIGYTIDFMVFHLFRDSWLGIEGLLTVLEMLFLYRLQSIINPEEF